MAWVQWSRTGRWGENRGPRVSGQHLWESAQKMWGNEREVALSLKGTGRVFQGGWSGQQGQTLLWTARMGTEMCPQDDISKRHLMISGRVGSREEKCVASWRVSGKEDVQRTSEVWLWKEEEWRRWLLGTWGGVSVCFKWEERLACFLKVTYGNAWSKIIFHGNVKGILSDIKSRSIFMTFNTVW